MDEINNAHKFTEAEIIAERAGINTKFPGDSEYAGDIGKAAAAVEETDRKDLLVNHSISKQTIRNHQLRQLKYASDEAKRASLRMDADANSEYRVNYKDLDAKKNRAVRNDKRLDTLKLWHNIHDKNNNSTVVLGKSEYTHSFNNKPLIERETRNGVGHLNNEVELPVNPKLDYLKPLGGRKYAVADPEPKISETHATHVWLKKEDRATRFEWLKNKCN